MFVQAVSIVGTERRLTASPGRCEKDQSSTTKPTDGELYVMTAKSKYNYNWHFIHADTLT